MKKEELEKYEDALYSLGDKLGCDEIFRELDKIEIKLPVNKSNSLKALLNENTPQEIREKALSFFQKTADDICSKLNLKSNKKRIRKSISKFKDLLKMENLRIDETAILELILDLPQILDIKKRREQQELVDKLIETVKWQRVGFKGLAKAYISDFIPQETLAQYAYN